MGKTADEAGDMSGDKLYQQRARQVLPILVRQAYEGVPVQYSQLAEEAGMPNPRNLNYVLGSIGTTLKKLGQENGAEIPPIQSLVISQRSGLPGTGIDSLFVDVSERQLTRKERERIYWKAHADVFNYTEWEEVLAKLGLEPAEARTAGELSDAATYGGGEESPEHKALKDAVAADPTLVRLPLALGKGRTETRIPSGDALDVLFQSGRIWTAVEVKSRKSSAGDITRGLYQCVKYRAVIEAWRSAHLERADVRVILALEAAFPPSLVSVRNALGIEVVDRIGERMGGEAEAR